MNMLERTDRPVYTSLLDFDFKRIGSVDSKGGVIKMYRKKPVIKKGRENAKPAD